MKSLIKYCCFATTVAGITAPVTYFTTKEDIKENERFKNVLAEEKEQDKNITDLSEKIKKAGTRINKLEACVEKAKKEPISISRIRNECSRE